jgi:Flp pilus assembly protein TadB
MTVTAERLGGSIHSHLPTSLQAGLTSSLDRAGVSAPPELVTAITLLATLGVGGCAFALAVEGFVPPVLVLLSFIAVPLVVVARVVRLAAGRRRAIGDQLPILVDLMALEQGGGGVGARTAMELVVNRLSGEAAGLLRNCLTASATAGTPSLDRQLETASGRFDISALSALAAVIRVQREEGVSASSPLGQLARGMRDRQRDEMLARGRKALVTMLLPIGLCILLPFVIIILYPALTRLAAAFS